MKSDTSDRGNLSRPPAFGQIHACGEFGRSTTRLLQRDAPVYIFYFVGDLAGQRGGLLPHQAVNGIHYLRVILCGGYGKRAYQQQPGA